MVHTSASAGVKPMMLGLPGGTGRLIDPLDPSRIDPYMVPEGRRLLLCHSNLILCRRG